MFEDTKNWINKKLDVQLSDQDELIDMNKERNLRAIDMQGVVAMKLAQSQQSVNNAENYPSTWTTNPDGGSNGNV